MTGEDEELNALLEDLDRQTAAAQKVSNPPRRYEAARTAGATELNARSR